MVKLHNGNKVALATNRTKGGTMKKTQIQEDRKTILDKLKEYKHGTQDTYENIAREIGVAYGTVFRWINGEPKLNGLHIKAVHEFLTKKNFITLLLVFGVSWVLHFDSGEGFKTVEMFKEFESYRQIEEFIRHAPKENKVFECEHNGEHGYCKVSDFNIEK